MARRTRRAADRGLWSAVFNTGVGCAFAAVPNLVIAAAEPTRPEPARHEAAERLVAAGG